MFHLQHNIREKEEGRKENDNDDNDEDVAQEHRTTEGSTKPRGGF